METSKELNMICVWYFVFELLGGATLLASVELSSLALQLTVIMYLFYIPTQIVYVLLKHNRKLLKCMRINVRLYSLKCVPALTACHLKFKEMNLNCLL